jgi:hypothetical protein
MPGSRAIARLTRVAIFLLLVTSAATAQACSGSSSSLPAKPASLPPAAAPSPIASPLPMTTPSPSPDPTPVPAPPSLWVSVLNGGDYGFFSAQTATGAVCNARALLPNGQDAPGLRNPQVARYDAAVQAGVVQWTYPQPPTEQGTGIHLLRCSFSGLEGTAWMYFEVGS